MMISTIRVAMMISEWYDDINNQRVVMIKTTFVTGGEKYEGTKNYKKYKILEV